MGKVLIYIGEIRFSELDKFCTPEELSIVAKNLREMLTNKVNGKRVSGMVASKGTWQFDNHGIYASGNYQNPDKD